MRTNKYLFCVYLFLFLFVLFCFPNIGLSNSLFPLLRFALSTWQCYNGWAGYVNVFVGWHSAQLVGAQRIARAFCILRSDRPLMVVAVNGLDHHARGPLQVCEAVKRELSLENAVDPPGRGVLVAAVAIGLRASAGPSPMGMAPM